MINFVSEKPEQINYKYIINIFDKSNINYSERNQWM